MASVRNILLVGNAGKGKSALANVLTETFEFKENATRINGNDEVKTKEFNYDEIKTKEFYYEGIKTKEFYYEGIKYRVIDAIEFGTFTEQDILSKLEDISDILSEGLNQILFVTSGRFTEEEAKAFDLLRNAIFDNHATDYTTIVCTHLPSFKNKKSCERDRRGFKKEIEKFSESLASTAIIYVDNPPMEGRLISIAEESRIGSRKILLNHLKTCQGIYKPKTLGEFREIVVDFNSIIKDTTEAINDAGLHCDDNVNFLKEFIHEREEIIENIEKHKEEIKKCMEVRSITSFVSHSALILGKGMTISGAFFPPILGPGIALSVFGFLGATGSDSAAILKESESYKSFEESLMRDKERCEKLENLEKKLLEESIIKFKEIRLRFEVSEYKNQNINREKIEIIKNVLNQVLGEENQEIDVKLEKNKGSENSTHSTGTKAVRATLETVVKMMPTPISFYFMYRDHKEVETRDSLSDMKTTAENLREEFKALEEKQQLLNNLYKKINRCKEEIARL